MQILARGSFFTPCLEDRGKGNTSERPGAGSLPLYARPLGKEETKAWQDLAITPGRYLDPKSLHHLNNAMLQRAGPNYTR